MMAGVERRLPAIYDALDSGNNKAAVKLINTALQKHSKHQMLRVLKAVALQRSGKLEEGFEVCEEVRQEVPTDEQLLTTMAVVYRRANQMQALAAAFTAASAARPRDASLLRGVFTNHVRSFDFAGQQQQAMKLHKLAGSSDEQYIWWSIVSIVLQARAASNGVPSALPAEKMLQLAEGLISKQIQRSSLQTCEQLMLYIHVLQVQNKHEQALQAVQGKLGNLVAMAAERRSLQADLHIAIGQLDQAAALFEEALQDNPDDWTSLQQYLDCLMPSTAEADSTVAKQLPLLEAPQAQLQRAERTVLHLQQGLQSNPQTKADADKGVIRGPQLAAVELQLRKLLLSASPPASSPGKEPPVADQTSQQNGNASGSIQGPASHVNGDAIAGRQSGKKTQGAGTQALAEAVLAYYKRLGHMLSCAADLRVYVLVVEGRSKQWLSEQLATELQRLQQNAECQCQTTPTASNSTGQTVALKHLRRQISAHQIQSSIGLPHKTAAAAEAHVAQLLKLYKHSLMLCQGLDPKEKAPGDDLIPLAVATLVAAKDLDVAEAEASETQSISSLHAQKLFQKRIVQALLVCEAAQKRSTVFAATRFACVALYGLLGAAGLAAANFDALAIKFIQHDTITGHHMLPVAMGCLDAATADRHIRDSIALHEDHQRDAGDTLMMAYECGTFTKVLEFVDFKERLERSHALAVAQNEKALLALKRAVPQGLSSIQAALQGFRHTDASQGSTAMPQLPQLDQLRFNEDLSTRPGWLDPVGGSPVGGLLRLWDPEAGLSSTGQRQPWWGTPGAAEGPTPQASAHRLASLKDLHLRWLMPRLAAQLVSGKSNGAEADANAQPLGLNPDLVELSKLLQCPFTQLEDWLVAVAPATLSAKQAQLHQQVQQTAPDCHGSAPQQLPVDDHVAPEIHVNPHANGAQQQMPLLARGRPVLQSLQLVSLAAFSAAAAGQEHWRHLQQSNSSSNPPQGLHPSCNIFIGCLGSLQHLFSSSCHSAASQLSTDAQSMLLGQPVLAAAHLVSEPATWTGLFLTSWQHMFAKKKQGSKSRGHATSDNQAPSNGQDDVVSHMLAKLHQAYTAGLQSVLDAINANLKMSTKSQVAAATELVLKGQDEALPSVADMLEGCMSQKDISNVLTAIVDNQKLTLKRVKLQLSELLSAV